MLTNSKRIEVCYSLLSTMLPEQAALDFGFSTDSQKRIFLAYTNQTPRPESDTVMYFSVKDAPYKQARSNPHHYDKNNIEVQEQMRQITLTIDVYSKVVPIGRANDVVEWLNSALISDMYEEWERSHGWSLAIESVEMMPDLTYLLEGQVWNNRAQLVVKLNYRDNTSMSIMTMTRVPQSLEDTPNSVNAQTMLKQ